ncbi:hypothetical protein [uncultured Roseibium sp.]|uniref:hypothetical protein n=1 Tax=uncultured Roseibium sp. TaxID=1936171 RepID=UPI00261901FD|nr:hypothetical protein [uncultured Roseibium sp.]
MTISPVKSQFIKPLLAVFRNTPGADDNGYFKLLAEKLARYDPVDLAAASDKLATTATKQTWPLLKDCIAACEEARAKRLAEETGKTNIPVPTEAGRMPEAAALRVLAANAPEVALSACDGDWIVCLLEFVQEHKRVPAGREIDDCRAQKSRTDTNIEDHCARAGGGSVDALLSRMIDGIHAKRERIKAEMKALLSQPTDH